MYWFFKEMTSKNIEFILILIQYILVITEVYRRDRCSVNYYESCIL